MRRAALHNLGCKVNAYETEAMTQLLKKAGYVIVPFEREADVYVVNTCTVTNIADRKSRQMLHRAKAKNPEAIVVAAGCFAQKQACSLEEDRDVDLIIGNDRKHELVELLDEIWELRGDPELCRTYLLDINDREEPFESFTLERPQERTRAFLKVQDGCNQFCSYCIIPYVRGRVRYKTPEAVLEEVNLLADSGCREVVLTGIHLSSYGAGGGASLLDLIRLIHSVRKIKRIRLGSLEPRIITEEFAAELASMSKVCPHFHLSLQSGCDETLKRMNRHYTTREYAAGCEVLRKVFDHPAITTDVITGFPGETEEEFAATEQFLREIGFYEMHVFKYSVRKGTRAEAMPRQIPEPVKAERSARLIALGEEMSTQFRRHYIGNRQEVLLEEKREINGDAYFTGYTKEYVKVAVPAQGQASNKLVSGKITGMLTEDILLMQP